MDLRLTFNEDPSNYDRYRPTYTPKLFSDILTFAKLDASKKVLEIGIGTGQATKPFLDSGCNVTAIELGESLANFSQRKFSSYPNFSIYHDSFENFVATPASFDMIYSATAFHWIPEEIAFPKVYQLLKENGVVALFWNHPYVNREQDPLHQEIQKAYRKFRPTSHPKSEFSDADCQRYTQALRQYGFSDVTYQLYHQTRELSVVEYIALLNTYSDHRALPLNCKQPLENAITQAILHFGGSIQIYDTIDLYLARK